MTGKISERIFRELFVARERGMSVNELADTIYYDDDEGGPLGYAKSIRSMIHLLRRRLVLHGYTIEADWGPGSRYRLVKL